MAKKTISITPSKNGPYVVKNLHELTESTDRTVPIKDPVIALCRCGNSKSKPFCDGTHGKIGFTSEKQEDRVSRHHDIYEGKEVTIHDDRGICSHAGYCTDGLPSVFRMGKKPWIDPNGASQDDIIETIKKCPSGALSYEIDGKRFTSYNEDPKIKINEDSPYRIEGFIDLLAEDNPESEEHYSLCRCGHSKNKPFCDGSHYYAKFKDNGIVKKAIPEVSSSDVPFDNKYSHIKDLAENPNIRQSAMRTLETFPDFKTLLFKANQLSRMPLDKDAEVNLKTTIGPKAKHPLTIDLPFFVSHMSYGALSKEAKIALAKGTALANTAMASGEGGMIPESRKAARHYIYEHGTSAFTYDEDVMKQADAVELKLGQGVKPGVGGELPANKVTAELAKVRGLKPGEASTAPNRLAGVDSIDDLIALVNKVRSVIEGKPVGIKIATSHLEEDLALALQANPDFITIDCRGGATGASPTFLKDNVGIPAVFAIPRARKVLDKHKANVTLIATGGFRDSTDIAKGIALGADVVALATASMIAIGCVQSRICHTGKCPVGIATQDEALRGLVDIDSAAKRYANFALGTAKELKMLARSHGMSDIHKLTQNDLMTLSNEVSKNTKIDHV